MCRNRRKKAPSWHRGRLTLIGYGQRYTIRGETVKMTCHFFLDWSFMKSSIAF